MFSRIILCLAVAAMFVPSAAAKTEDVPPPALYKSYPADAEVNAQLLFLDRVSFVKDMYAMSEEEMDNAMKVMKGLVPRQEQYDSARCVSLRRIRLAMDLVASDQSRDKETRDRLVHRFQDQINGIHTLAPLSFTNVTKAMKKLLPADRIEAGNKRIVELLVSRTGKKAEEIDATDIDMLLAGRVAPGEKPKMPQPPQSSEDGPRLRSRPYGPTPEERAAERSGRNMIQPKAKSASKQVQVSPEVQSKSKPANKAELLAERMKHRKTPPPQAPKPRIIDTAPPVADWKATLATAMSKYEYTDKQKKAGEAVVRGVMSRAAKLQEKKAAAADADAKTDAQKRLDRLYDEMQQRLDAIATVEQRMNAESKAKAAKSASAEKAEE